MKIKLDKVENTYNNHWVGYKNDEQVSEIELYEDEDGEMWLNGAETNEGRRGNGYCTQIVEHLIEIGQEVYFSSASKFEHELYNSNDEADVRYLAGGVDEFDKENGVAFVASLIERKVIPKEWYKNPFQEDYDY